MARTLRDPQYVEIISRLRLARRSAGLSQLDLAARLGQQQSYVSKIESAERRLDVLETLAMCRALRVTLRQILPAEFGRTLGCEEVAQ